MWLGLAIFDVILAFTILLNSAHSTNIEKDWLIGTFLLLVGCFLLGQRLEKILMRREEKHEK